MNWIEFKTGNPAPPERRFVLVELDMHDSSFRSSAIVVGYLKYAAGDKDSPQFICHSIPGNWTVKSYCDCLGDNFERNGWPASTKVQPK